MPGILANRNHCTWLLLVVATIATFSLRLDGAVGFVAGSITLAIAYLKGRLVILDFMEFRHAPLLWRGIYEGWLAVITLAILFIYRFGVSGMAVAFQ